MIPQRRGLPEREVRAFAILRYAYHFWLRAGARGRWPSRLLRSSAVFARAPSRGF